MQAIVHAGNRAVHVSNVDNRMTESRPVVPAARAAFMKRNKSNSICPAQP